jgi:altronate dehydratase
MAEDALARWEALQLDPCDDVATALRPLAAGHTPAVGTADGGSHKGPPLTAEIPRGHKFALRRIAVGETVRKYGTPIGIATEAIAAGDHVHLHNLEGLAGREARRAGRA